MLIKSPTGKYADLDEDVAKEWLLQGFTIVGEHEALQYQVKRKKKFDKIDEKFSIEKKRQKYLGKDLSIYLSSVYEGNDGYGTSKQQMKLEIEKLGVKVSENYTNQKIGLLYHEPMNVSRLRTPIKILYTMFESDRLPDDWMPYLEKFDKIIVPSEWCADAFRDRGFYPEVVNLGYNQKDFSFKERKTALEQKRDFVFLHYNAYNIRKGWPELHKAFTREFRNTEPVTMVYKTNLKTIPLPLPPSQYPNIKVINKQMSSKELAELTQSADCFVFPSRGEGFGITPLEAMGTGASAIVPNAHGISEYFNSNYMYEVKVEKTCPALYFKWKNTDVGNMVVCDIDDLRKQMRYVYEHQKENLEMGEKAASYVKRYHYKETAKRLVEIFDRMDKIEVKDYDPNYLKLEAI